MKVPAYFFDLKAVSLPVIEHYKRDLLVHDRRIIRRNAGVPFLHFSGACGTHIVMMMPASRYPAIGEKVPYLFHNAERETLLDGVLEMVKALVGQGCHSRAVQYFDGSKLHKIRSGARAIDLAREYASSIKAQWAREERERREAWARRFDHSGTVRHVLAQAGGVS